jgi:hypothetical protein
MDRLQVTYTAKPELMYPETTAFKSTRPPGSGDLTQYSTGYSYSGFALDAADGQIPISCILTSASLHDSQAAIPLALLSAQRMTSLYDLMDSAYDDRAIREHSRALGHIPIIDACPRDNRDVRVEEKRRKLLGYNFAEDLCYRERTTVERVRGNAKVMCHLMFGILALAVDQILRLIT